MTRRVAFVVFEDLTALDLVGVYTALTRLDATGHADLEWEVVAYREPVRAAAGLSIVPDRVGEPLDADVVVVPGGPGTRALVGDDGFLSWLRGAESATWVGSACTGSLLLGAAGFLEGRVATTHPDAVASLEALCESVTDDRVVADNSIVTARGVTASIDLGLWFCEALAGDAGVTAVRSQLDYPYGPV